MFASVKHTLARFPYRRRLRLAAAFGCGLALALLAYAAASNLLVNEIGREFVPSAQPAATSTLTLPAAAPTRLIIPALGLEAEFGPSLGLNADQSIEVPHSFEQVGWYQYGPTPGELGPAVVLGHVDSYQGPAVFFSLGQLKPGDDIRIERADGTTAIFTVTALERHPQSGFPTEAVYGDLDYAGLRLITCSGTYNRGAQRYTHNLIVFAQLATSTSATQ